MQGTPTIGQITSDRDDFENHPTLVSGEGWFTASPLAVQCQKSEISSRTDVGIIFCVCTKMIFQDPANPLKEKKMKALVLGFFVAALSGCSVFTSPQLQPVIEDHTSNWFGMAKMGVYSTTAARREVIVKFPENKFCAEPPPDVAESLASSLSLLLQGSVNDTTDKQASARLEVTRTLSTSIRSLFVRSQGSQVLRDGLFNLCQAYLNGAVTEAEYKDHFNKLVDVSSKLILKELPDMKDKRAEDAVLNAAAAAAEANKSASGAATSAEAAKLAADRAETAASKKKTEP